MPFLLTASSPLSLSRWWWQPETLIARTALSKHYDSQRGLHNCYTCGSILFVCMMYRWLILSCVSHLFSFSSSGSSSFPVDDDNRRAFILGYSDSRLRCEVVASPHSQPSAVRWPHHEL